MLSLPLENDAMGILQAIPMTNHLNYEELTKWLEMCFVQHHKEPVFHSQSRSRYQKPNKILQEFEVEIRRLVRRGTI